jgi:hypothetical protein
MSKPWFMYDIVVPFGDPGFDVAFGGPHDLDIGAPPNYPVTALLPGTVASMSEPAWGKQVGIRLDHPYNGIPFFAFLHLSAVDPALALGRHVSKGDRIGWVGGASDEAQYAGTSNPTGQNFLNTSLRSSRIQVGIALMRGPEYGVDAGWEDFPPVDWSLDPTQLIRDVQQEQASISGGVPTMGQFSNQAAIDVWNSQQGYFTALGQKLPARDTGIFNAWTAAWKAGYFKGVCLSHEYHLTLPDGSAGVAQNFAGGTCTWNQHAVAAWL